MSTATAGRRIFRLRLERGLTQRELGDAAGINHSAISRMERGQRAIRNIHHLRSIAKALRVKLGAICPEGAQKQ